MDRVREKEGKRLWDTERQIQYKQAKGKKGVESVREGEEKA